MVFDWLWYGMKWHTVLYGIDDDHIFLMDPNWDWGL
jgi:hypothetical protein